jgi:hypothetical protein
MESVFERKKRARVVLTRVSPTFSHVGTHKIFHFAGAVWQMGKSRKIVHRLVLQTLLLLLFSL